MKAREARKLKVGDRVEYSERTGAIVHGEVLGKWIVLPWVNSPGSEAAKKWRAEETARLLGAQVEYCTNIAE